MLRSPGPANDRTHRRFATLSSRDCRLSEISLVTVANTRKNAAVKMVGTAKFDMQKDRILREHVVGKLSPCSVTLSRCFPPRCL